MADAPPVATLILADPDLVVTGKMGVETVRDGDHLLDHVPGIPREQAAEVCRTILNDGTFDGETRFFRTVINDPDVACARSVVLIGPREDADGVLTGVLCAEIKMNGSLSAEAPPSAGLYESMVENAADLIFLLNPAGIITFINRQVETYPGLSVEGMIGRHFSEIIHPDDVIRCADVINKAAAEGIPVMEVEFRVPVPDGPMRYIVANGRFVEEGDRRLILAIGRDITESVDLKRRLTALHGDLADRVNRLAMLERLAKSVNAERDVNKVLNACMREIADLVNYDLGVVVLLNDDGEAEVFPFSKDGEPQPATKVHLGADQMRRVESISEPVVFLELESIGPFHSRPETFDPKSGSGAAIPLMSMGRMFGLLKVWSEERDRYGDREVEILQSAAEHLSIAAYNAVLYEAEQRKSFELAALAQEARHRVKNNLQMVSGLLNMSLNDPDPGGRAVERCLRQVGAIATVNDLLSPDNMAAKIALEGCLTKIAAGAIQAMGRADSVALAVTGADCLVTGDAATAVGLIVNELVSNAVEHGFKGTSEGRIEVRVSHAEGFCTVEVIDDGIGLPPDFAAPEVPDTASGLGLAASLARYGLGGALEIERAERGTCARITVKGE